MKVEEVSDEELAGELAALINVAYAAGEGDLFAEPRDRTSPARVAELIRAGGMLAARSDGRIVGCAAVFPIDDGAIELGYMSAARRDWGSGAGRALVRYGEQWARGRGAEAMQMKLLVPRGGSHPLKHRLRDWYERRGYRLVRTAPFDEAGLVEPAEFLVFQKRLAD